jgi:hypothetical protein
VSSLRRQNFFFGDFSAYFPLTLFFVVLGCLRSV